MNNNQFRRLVLDTPARKGNDDADTQPQAARAALGTKRASFVPMTPRPGGSGPGGGAGGGGSDADFARQVRERHAALQPAAGAKRFKSSAPKGSRFAAGYTDRAKARAEDEQQQQQQEAAPDNDKAARIAALEQQAKLGQISRETFEALRDEITAGNVAATHLVKGLDRKLLARVRRGEDVLGLRGDAAAEGQEGEGEGEGEAAPLDVDAALDALQGQDVQAVQHERAEKKGVVAAAPRQSAGVKRSRDEIMAELKAQRLAAAQAKAAAAPEFDARWRKVGQKDRPKIEIDHKGREVLITVDEEGNVKKKVRKTAPKSSAEAAGQAANLPDASKPLLDAGAFVPDLPKTTEDPDAEEDDDIFADVGADYNPLGDDDDDDDDEDDQDDQNDQNDRDDNGETDAAESLDPKTGRRNVNSRPTEQRPATAESASGGVVTLQEAADVAPRNYFNDNAPSPDQGEQERLKGIEDILKRAAKIGANLERDGDDDGSGGGGKGESKAERDARLARRAKMLAQEDRDLEDMDLGFGSSRFADEEDGGEGKKVRLSQWKGGAATADDEGWEEDTKSDKKKRKPKKRKGDVNNAADIMRVIEGRKAGGK